jgi:hypothetical protein
MLNGIADGTPIFNYVKVFSLFPIKSNRFRGLDFDRQVNLFIIFLGAELLKKI